MSLRRGPSAAWSRLKGPTTDPLEEVGLISKGDKRLLDLKCQEKYFSTIVTRYMRYCAGSSRENGDLEEAFRSLTLDGEDTTWPKERPEPKGLDAGELELIIMSMRKLREGLVATARADQFAQRALIFIARAAILTSTYEAYFPAILRLLHQVHRQSPLPRPELREFVGYLVLDLACRQGLYSEAMQIKQHWALKDLTIERSLRALMRDDWVTFWHLSSDLGTYHRRLLGFAEAEMRKHALKCLGSTYLKVNKTYLEKCAKRKWSDLQLLDNVSWELENDSVIIRKITKRS